MNGGQELVRIVRVIRETPARGQPWFVNLIEEQGVYARALGANRCGRLPCVDEGADLRVQSFTDV